MKKTSLCEGEIVLFIPNFYPLIFLSKDNKYRKGHSTIQKARPDVVSPNL